MNHFLSFSFIFLISVTQSQTSFPDPGKWHDPTSPGVENEFARIPFCNNGRIISADEFPQRPAGKLQENLLCLGFTGESFIGSLHPAETRIVNCNENSTNTVTKDLHLNNCKK
jgi:hypothetical protein